MLGAGASRGARDLTAVTSNWCSQRQRSGCASSSLHGMVAVGATKSSRAADGSRGVRACVPSGGAPRFAAEG